LNTKLFLIIILSTNASCAVSEAGITILPHPPNAVEESTVDDGDILETNSVTLKWPKKPGVSEFDLFDSEDTWFDAPPEGFSLTVSLIIFFLNVYKAIQVFILYSITYFVFFRTFFQLSPFATMWNAFFSWITSSSLAYIYGRDVSFHEEFLSVNGREYPSKIVLTDGRSSEIKQTLVGCLARALPAVVEELRLPIPVDLIEQAMVRFLSYLFIIVVLN